MLDKRKDCSWIIPVVILLLFFMIAFPFLIVIFVIIFYNSKLNLEEIIKKIWIENCVWIEKITKDKWIQDWKINREKFKKVYYDYIKEEKQKKNNTESLEIKSKIKKNEYEVFDEYLDETKKLKMETNNIKKASTKKVKDDFYKSKYSSKNKLKTYWTDKKLKKYEFNWWKSIWDNHVGVLDEFDKK